MEAALNSATASMKTAWKGLSSKKVHPSWETSIFFFPSLNMSSFTLF
jgi:hypothetical protein